MRQSSNASRHKQDVLIMCQLFPGQLAIQRSRRSLRDTKQMLLRLCQHKNEEGFKCSSGGAFKCKRWLAKPPCVILRVSVVESASEREIRRNVRGRPGRPGVAVFIW